MPDQTVTIILNKVYNKSVPKPNNLRPEYDLEHIHNVQTYNDNYRLKKVVEIERRYDYLSIIKLHETSQQWAFRVRDALQELLSKREYSLYYVYSLFASFGQEKNKMFYDYDIDGLRDILHEYRRPSVHKSQIAIYFKC